MDNVENSELIGVNGTEQPKLDKRTALKLILDNPAWRIDDGSNRMDWTKAFAERPDLAAIFNWPADKAQIYRAYDSYKKREKYAELKASGLSRAEIAKNNPRYKIYPKRKTPLEDRYKNIRAGTVKLYCDQKLPNGDPCRRFFYRTQDLGKHKRSLHGIVGVSHSGHKPRGASMAHTYKKGPNKGRTYDEVWRERRANAGLSKRPDRPLKVAAAAAPPPTLIDAQQWDDNVPKHCPECGYSIRNHAIAYAVAKRHSNS